jgi:hypothetical protein
LSDPNKYTLYVDVNFSSPDSWEFTDAQYQFYGNGDIEQGKRNVEAAIQRVSDAIDKMVLNDLR